MEAEELLDHQRELVGGAVGVGRDAPVVGQLATVEEPDDGLRVADVDREQHRRESYDSGDVEADVERARRMRERADRDEVGAGFGVRADSESSVTPPDTSTRHAPSSIFDRLAHFARASCCRACTMSTPASRASVTCSSVSHSTSTMRPGQRAVRALDGLARARRPARWLSLISTASESESRWLKPPPARTAARLQRPQAGQRLARVADARPRRRAALHVAPRQRRDAGAVRQEVERDPFAAEDRTQRAAAPGRASSRPRPRRRRARPTRRSRAGRPGGTPRSRRQFRRARPPRARRTMRPRPSGLRRCTRST